MCAIYGFLNYGKKIPHKVLTKLLREISIAAEVRGTDSTGISYVRNGEIVTFKKPKSAHKVHLYFPKETTALIGHNRLTTQGNEKFNYNNHPFEGATNSHTFALAHNGIIYNDKELKHEKQLPDTEIETDSYVAVQLIEQQNIIDENSIKAMAETVYGSFVFTILRDDNTLFLVKGSNPITLLHFPEYGLYIYASTLDILKNAMKSARFSAECENVKVNTGDIVRIDSDGRTSAITFEEVERHYSFNSYRLTDWYEWYGLEKTDEEYENDLLMICGCYGVDREDVELLFEFGYSSDEVEEMLMDHDLFEQAMEEIKTLYQR